MTRNPRGPLGSPVAVAAAVLAAVFVVEFVVMRAMWRALPPLDPLRHSLVDAAVLTVLAAPVVYLLVFHPMRVHVEQRREARERLQESEEQYRRLVESSVDAIVSCDEDREIVGWNPAAEKMFGYSGEEVVGKHLDDVLVPDSYRQSHVNGFQRFLETEEGEIMGRTVEMEAERKGGDVFPVEMSLSAAQLDGSFRFTAVVRDITDRKRMERERELLFDVTKSVHESSGFEEALDLSLKEIFERTGWVYGEVWVPEEETGSLRFASARHDDDARLHRFEEVSRGVAFDPGEGLPGRVWESGEPEWIPDVSEEPETLFIRTGVAEELGLRAALGVPATADGDVVAVLVFFMFRVGGRDAEMVDLVTAVAGELGMTLKRRRLEEEVERSRDKLEVLNRLVRHDIRNDMQLVTGWGEMLRTHVDEEGEELLDRILDAGYDVIDLTFTARDYMAIVMGEAPEVRPVDLGTVLRKTVGKTRARHQGAEVRLGNVPAGLVVSANDMVDSVFRNILHNAVQHNDKEVPTIEVTVEEREEDVVVSVADNGPGIPEERKRGIFEHREKDVTSEGSGIGLYLVHSLVEQYGGDVWAEDNDPVGTVLKVRLRKAREEGG